MPITWSAVKVSEAMDEVDDLVAEAKLVLDRAYDKVKEATKISDLPDYMQERLNRLMYSITARSSDVHSSVRAVRGDIPDGALEAERKRGDQGKLTL